MLVKTFHRLFPTCGWIFSSPQEAGSRTASLKRSNQVRGLRHSRSVSCSVKWDSSTSLSPHCHQLTWSFISFFLFILPRYEKYFPIHGMNQAADIFITLTHSPETPFWICHPRHWNDAHAVKAGVLNMDMDKCMLSMCDYPIEIILRGHISRTFEAM